MSGRAADGRLVTRHERRTRMNTTVFDISISLDGFVTASDQTPEEPLGVGGEQLHEWAFGADETNRRYFERAGADLGAVICGRRTYDDSLPFWGADGPTGLARKPVFVVTHRAPADDPPGGVYRFVTDGIESALAQARTAAGGRGVSVMGGADLGRQFIAAGLVDEISLHVVPVLFGSGTRLFAELHKGHVRLEPVDVLSTPSATHLRYRVRR
jgi:dihydrofolate reductase